MPAHAYWFGASLLLALLQRQFVGCLAGDADPLPRPVIATCGTITKDLAVSEQ